ncbi:MAG: hypothetical protein ACE5DX_01005 [Candidatus Dojkabacteria bacterium]
MSSSKGISSELVSEFKTSRRSIIPFLIAVVGVSIILLFVLKFASDNNTTESDLPDTEITSLQFNGQNFPTLRLGHYALWAVDSTDKSHFLKRFNSVGGSLVSLNGEKLETWDVTLPQDITKFNITLEREGDRNEEPNEFLLFSADALYSDTSFSSTFENPTFDPTVEPKGSFILATPTDGNSKINEASGVWLIRKDRNTPSLSLPEIDSAQWVWQTRLVSNSGTTLLLGDFRKPDEADNSSKYSQTKASGFRAPGEDLLKNLPEGLTGPINLANGSQTLIVSLEPHIDGIDFTGELIFLEVLRAEIPLNLKPGSPVELENTLKPLKLVLSTSS